MKRIKKPAVIQEVSEVDILRAQHQHVLEVMDLMSRVDKFPSIFSYRIKDRTIYVETTDEDSHRYKYPYRISITKADNDTLGDMSTLEYYVKECEEKKREKIKRDLAISSAKEKLTAEEIKLLGLE